MRADERHSTLTPVVAWRIFDHSSQAVTACDAPIVVKVLPCIAPHAVLAVLACTVVADLAGCDGGVVLRRTLAAVAYGGADQPARPAGKGLGTPTFKLSDP